MSIRILKGSCLETLSKIEDQSINTCITSPPYWGLRDYGTAEWVGGDPECTHMRTTKVSEMTATGHKNMFKTGNAVGDAIFKQKCALCGAIRKDSQLGLEETPEEFVENLVKVFREVKRVLRNDGTVWLNLGDSYIGGGRGWKYSKEGTIQQAHIDAGVKYGSPTGKINGLKSKDLVGIPWRVAFALQADGWYLRQDIIWHKPNPMPESVKDRCTKSHEYIFLLSKSPKYYFDNEAIKEDSITKSKQTNKKNTHGKYETKENEAKNRQGIHSNRGDKLIEVRTKLPKQKDLVDFLRSKTTAKILANSTDIPLTKIEHWFRYDETGFAYPTIEDWNKVKEFIDDWSNEFNLIDEALTYYDLKTDEVMYTDKKNKRSVWTVSTKSFKDAHFATFPTELIEPCVLAGCPEKICADCNTSYVRQVESKRFKRNELPKDDPRYRPNTYEGSYKDINGKADAGYTETKDLGLKKQCDCNTKETKAGTVLDPFGGSGTTALVANQYNRSAVLCELNEEYIEIAEKRLKGSFTMFTSNTLTIE